MKNKENATDLCVRDELFVYRFMSKKNDIIPKELCQYRERGLIDKIFGNDLRMYVKLFDSQGMEKDSQEGKLIYDYFQEVLRRLLKSCKISKSFYDVVKSSNQTHSLLFGSQISKYKLFLWCMSTSLDDSKLWKEHADNGDGISIRFNPAFIQTELMSKYRPCYFYKVLYDRNEIEEYVESAITDLFSIWERCITESILQKDQFNMAMSHWLHVNRCRIKEGSKFSWEREYRIVLPIPVSAIKNFLAITECNGRACIDLSFEKMNRYIVSITTGNRCQLTDEERKLLSQYRTVESMVRI